MFIPTWLLVVIAVIIVSVFLPGIWEALKGIALLVCVLLVIASIPASLYFFYRNETQTAWIVSIPWIAIAVWGLLLGGVESIKTSAWLHDIRSRATTSPEKVERLRRKYADAIGLVAKMWQFREDVKYFPSWYRATNGDGTPWTSNVIGKNEIIEIHGPEEANAAEVDLSGSKIEPPFVLYTFSSDGKPYAFIARDGVKPRGFDHDADGEPLAACGVWVVEKPSRVVLSIRLAHYWGEYDDTLSRERTYLEAFKPGPWVPTLLGIVDRVHQDEREKHESWRKQWNRERAEKNFT